MSGCRYPIEFNRDLSFKVDDIVRCIRSGRQYGRRGLITDLNGKLAKAKVYWYDSLRQSWVQQVHLIHV